MLKYHPLEVVELRRDAEHTVYLRLHVPETMRETYRFVPGQHVGVRLTVGGEELRRNYSIASLPGSPTLLLGVRVQPGGRVSGQLARELRVGGYLDVLPPNGSFRVAPEPQRKAAYTAFVAGSGIGGTLAILGAVLNDEPRSRCRLFYGNRDAGRIMFLEELQALKDRYPTRFALHFLQSRERQDVELLNGRLDAAKLATLAGTLCRPLPGEEFFLCGPGDMIESLGSVLGELGVPRGQVHSEHYNVLPERSRRAAPATVHAGIAQVTVRLDGRERNFSMPMQGESIVDAAARAGIDLPFACKGGVCSTCRTKVVTGSVEMAENYALEPAEVEAGYVLACQSRPTSAELSLDYDVR
jgi:ring-1,2-phenylacetyl-CoA epoxidase subunit PaaE